MRSQFPRQNYDSKVKIRNNYMILTLKKKIFLVKKSDLISCNSNQKSLNIEKGTCYYLKFSQFKVKSFN